MTLYTEAARVLMRRPTRPFANAHWALTVGFIGLWDLLLLSQPCNDGPYYAETCAATATVLVSLWVADRMPSEVSGWRRVGTVVGTSIYDILVLFFLVLLFAVPPSLFLPAYQCYTPRAKVSEIILAASLYRTLISERVEKQKSLKDIGVGLSVKIEGRVIGGLISREGTVLIMSDDPTALVVMRPSFENGELKWKCSGFPLKLMPASCREIPTF